ncbi:MAG: ISAs1 family transposase [Oscillospiraceae bacterium]|jgi:predicted transposase YbfD/YdcC|nr:ISAs1 family transposase [Oscillospiraceae bacterium]
MLERLCKAAGNVSEPRRLWGNFRHKLVDILVIALLTILCGGEDFVDMEEFGQEREEILRKILVLPNGIPDSDTFRRVLERVNPAEMSRWLDDWIEMERKPGGRLVNFDGKAIRGSENTSHKAYHVVSAWVAEHHMTLGELAVEEKSNEITAIPRLLDLIDIAGDIVTSDAMGCQTEIVKKICEKKADYVIGLKGNQPTMDNEVAEYFSAVERENLEVLSRWTSPVEKDHGRIEKREVTVISANWFADRGRWEGLKTFIQVRSFVTKKGEQTVSIRRYISSASLDAQEFCGIIRGHWSIENQLHWCLDVVFREDSSRARKDNSPLNLNMLRKMALSLLKATDMGKRVSLKKKMFKAALNPERLLQVLMEK